LRKVLEIARVIRSASEVPLLLFTYLNPALHYGLEKLAKDAKESGIDGVLLTDLSVEEAGPFMKALRDAGLDTVFLAAPTSTERRLKLVAEYSSGFVYLVSRTGVTGERADISDALELLVNKMRTVTNLPLAGGFGISTPEQATTVAKMADGVVVGSAIVRQIEKDLDGLETFVRSLAQGMKR
jgi:tryptophan synthase alpha chain